MVIALLVWIWKARANLRDLGLDGLRHGPWWAVAAWFVPIANLFVPFQSMRELWNRSAGEDEFQATGPVGPVSGWWACWIGGGVLTAIFTATILIDAQPGVYVVTSPAMISIIVLLGTVMTQASVVFLLVVVRRITALQRNYGFTGRVFD